VGTGSRHRRLGSGKDAASSRIPKPQRYLLPHVDIHNNKWLFPLQWKICPGQGPFSLAGCMGDVIGFGVVINAILSDYPGLNQVPLSFP
jgi:hypothetical protein